MGFLDGIHRFFTGLGGSAENIGMIPVDLATAPWSSDDSQNGTALTVFAKTLEKRLAGAASDTLGPQGSVGTVIGAIPKPIRQPFANVIKPVMAGLNDIYTYGISQPVAAVEIAGASALSGHGGGGKSLADAYGMAKYGMPGVSGTLGKGVSPGQGFAILTHGENPWNANDMEKFQGTGYYKSVSGLADAVTRLVADPTVLATEGLSAVRDIGLATEAAGTATEQLGRIQKVSNALEAAQPGRLAVKGAAKLLGEDNVGRLQAAFQAPKVNRFLGAVQNMSDRAGAVAGEGLEGLERTAAGPVSTGDTLFNSYAEGVASGKPGLAANIRPLTDEEAAGAADQGINAKDIHQFVNRDASGTPNGILAVARGENGSPLFFHTAVRRADQGQGIASSLFKKAQDAGYDLESVSGQQGLTAEGAKFALARRAGRLEGVAGEIRSKLLPDHPYGAAVSSALADAAAREATNPGILNKVFRSMTGDADATASLMDGHADLVGEINRLKGSEADLLDRLSTAPSIERAQPSLFDAASRVEHDQAWRDLQGVQEELKTRYADESFMNRTNASAAKIESIPTMGIGTKLRMWDTYQESPFAKVLHVVSNRLPGNIIKFDDPAADTRLSEYMRAGGVAPEAANRIRAQLINARDMAGAVVGDTPMAATGMQAAVDAAHEAVQNSLLDKLGVEDPAVRQAMLDKVAEQTGRNRDFIDKTTNFDGLGKDRMTFPNDQGDVESHGMPMGASQLKNSEFLPDVGKLETEMRKVAKFADPDYQAEGIVNQMRQFRAVHPGTNIPVDVLTAYQRTWRTLELMRAGVPAKIVGIDALKMVAKIGALPTADLYIGAGADWLKGNLLSRIPGLPSYEDEVARLARGDWYNQAQTASVAGHAVEGSMGTPFDAQNKFKMDVESGASFDKNVGGKEAEIENRIRTGAYQKGILPGDPTYNASWEHAVNNQIGRDAMFRKLLTGSSDEEVKNWLSTTMAGRQYAQRMFFRSSGNHVDDWISTARDQVDRYLPSEELKSKALSGTAKAEDLHNLVGGTPLAEGEHVINNTLFRYTPMTEEELVTAGRRFPTMAPEELRDAEKLSYDELNRRFHEAADEQQGLGFQDPAYQAANDKASLYKGLMDRYQIVGKAPAGGDAMLPTVHGEVLKENMAKSTGVKALQDGAMKVRGAIMGKTIDTLVRSKMFDALYTNEVGRLATFEERLMAARGETGVDMDRMSQIQNEARQTALQQMNDTLYDLADKRQLAGYLKLASPFFNVWQQNVEKWLGIAAENPAFIARMHMALQAPEKMGLIHDENGVEVTPESDATKLGTERYLTLPLPKFMSDTIPGARMAGGVKFNWRAANVIMQGLPSVGPLMQVPVSTLIRSKPELADSLKFMVPHGVPANAMDALTPGLIKEITQGNEGNDTYKNLVTNRMKDLEVDYNLGKRKDQPTFKDAENDVQAFWAMRNTAKFMAILPVTFSSPYQKYMDAYRAREQAQSAYDAKGLKPTDPGYDPTMDGASGQKVDPSQWFINTYGREFFPLTQAVTKSNNGVPSTVEAYRAEGKYKKLIEDHPELGGLIVGSEGAGKFSQAVYELQKEKGLSPGDTTPQRTDLDPKAAMQAANTSQGWRDYEQAMQKLDNILHGAGLPNYGVKGAQQLRLAKMLITQNLATKNPDWSEAFYTKDETKWQDKIKGMESITGDDRLMQRPEIQGLKQYLDARRAIVNVLDGMQKKPTDQPVTINSAKAVQVKAAWDSIVMKLKGDNIPFSSLYNRYLSNDPMTDENKLPVA